MRKRPPKREDVLDQARLLWNEGSYLFRSHALDRQGERAIIDPEVGQVIQSGWHEKRKDTFDVQYNAWNYAIRGRTVDSRNLRVIISFEMNGEQVLLIITVIDLDVKNED